jgi:hypothetical protein
MPLTTGALVGSILLSEISLSSRSAPISASSERILSFECLEFSREAKYTASCIPSFGTPNTALTCHLVPAISEHHSGVRQYRVRG